LWLGAMTVTRHPVMRLLCVSSRSISLKITSRAAGDDSEPSNVISGVICISVLLVKALVAHANPRLTEWLHRGTFSPDLKENTRID
jgi:hypothetical protein